MRLLEHPGGPRRDFALATAILATLVPGLVATGCGDSDDCNADLAQVTYRADVQFVIARNCLACHDIAKVGPLRRDAPDTHNFNTFTEVLKFADRMADRIALGEMPPEGNPRVSRCDQEIFAAWVAAGKPES